MNTPSAFMGRQYHLEVAGNDYSLLKKADDQPTIGLLLCRDKNNIEVEFALRDMNKPMGVSEYTLVETLPDNLKAWSRSKTTSCCRTSRTRSPRSFHRWARLFRAGNASWWRTARCSTSSFGTRAFRNGQQRVSRRCSKKSSPGREE